MALTFDFKKALEAGNCTDDDITYIDADGDRAWSAEANSIVFQMMFIGMHDITEANAPEVWRRVDLSQRINGSLWNKARTDDDGNTHVEPVFLTKEDIKKFIGLTTNVPNESKQKFNNRVCNLHEYDKWED